MRKLIIVLISMTVLFSTAALAFDNEPAKIDISDMYSTYSYVVINTYGTALGVAKKVDLSPDVPLVRTIKRKTNYLLRGVGFVIKEGYIVTAAHVVHPAQVLTKGDHGSALAEVPIKVLSKHIVISPDSGLEGLSDGIPVELYHLDVGRDLAILKYDKDSYDLYKPIPFRMVNTRGVECGRRYDALTSDMAVSTVVRERDEEGRWGYSLEVRNAKLISSKLTDPKMHHVMLPTDFSADILVFHGDSGSPAFAFMCGEPVIIGVVRATYFEGMFNCRPDTPFTAIARIDTIKLILEAE